MTERASGAVLLARHQHAQCDCTYDTHEALTSDLHAWLLKAGGPEAIWVSPKPRALDAFRSRPVAFADPQAFAYWLLAGSPLSATFRGQPALRRADPSRHAASDRKALVEFQFDTRRGTISSRSGDTFHPLADDVAALLRPVLTPSFLIRSEMTGSAPTLVALAAYFGADLTRVVVDLIVETAGGLDGTTPVPAWIQGRWPSRPGLQSLFIAVRRVHKAQPELFAAFDPAVAARLGRAGWHERLEDLFVASAALGST